MMLYINKKCFTLVELIAVIVILSLAIPALLKMFTQANLNSVIVEAVSKASYYDEGLMEEIRSKSFDEDDNSPWSSTLGPDTTTTGLDGSTMENNSDHNNWDDVDDYNGYSDNPVSGYTRSVSVEYVELNGTKWQVASTPPTDYKKVTVSVSRSDGIIGPVNLIVLVSGY